VGKDGRIAAIEEVHFMSAASLVCVQSMAHQLTVNTGMASWCELKPGLGKPRKYFVAMSVYLIDTISSMKLKPS
jgi:hypothetical protein